MPLTASQLLKIEKLLESDPNLKQSLLEQESVAQAGGSFGIEAEQKPSPYYVISLMEENTVVAWNTPAGQRQSRVVRLGDDGLITILSGEYFYVPFEIKPNISKEELIKIGLLAAPVEEDKDGDE